MEAPEPPETPHVIIQAIQQARSWDTWYSFGDDGTTATVNASGALLQMSRFFSDREFKTGFCVDNSSIVEPYFVIERIENLFSRATDPFSGEGIDVTMLGLPLEYTGLRPASPRIVHDRWPHFTTLTKDDIKMESQFMASRGSIYQTAEFDLSRSSRKRELPKMVGNKDLLIRDLDFVNHANRFNETEPNDPSYRTQVSDEGLFIRSHEISPEAHVVLFISAFSEAMPVKFVKTDEGGFELQWSEATKKRFEDQGKFELTIAYTLEFLPRESLALTVPVCPDSVMKRIQEESFESQSFTEDPHLDPLLGQNLEYILSVCSIPVTPADSSGTCAIALTCGDLDGHRVATAASFHAFQSLLLALKHFNGQRSANSGCECEIPRESCPSYICRMTARILHTCKGHLKWLFEKAERSEGFFAPHYWVDGHEITGWEKNAYLPGKALVDTPFQLIKAGDFQSLHEENELPEEWKSVIKEAASAWKGADAQLLLHRPRLDWRAIKVIETLKINLPHIPVVIEKKTQFDGTTPERQSKKVRNYSSTRVQQNILKRFTTENPLSRKRMIAVSRGPGQSRFLLRNKDAALFHAMELGFFDRPGAKGGPGSWQNKVDVWKNTIDCQMRHEDNDDNGWNEPLRFALSIIMARNGKQMNARPVPEMRVHALSILLQSCSLNGIFPGALDENNEPVMYSDELMRDTYWGITFEIPYILWKYCSRPAGQTPPADASDQTLRSPTHDQMPSVPTHPEFWAALKEALEQQVGGKGTMNSFGHSMKHTFPFNNVVYQENIVELSDEWLYNKPSFFVPPQDHRSANKQESTYQHPEVESEAVVQMLQETFETPRLQRTLEGLQESSVKFQFVGTMVDIPKSKHLKKKTPHLARMMTLFTKKEEIQYYMMEGRLPEKAKKRLWAFFAKDPSENKICCRTSSFSAATFEHGPERTETVKDKELSSFFEKHETYDKLFMEETASVLNTWTTELHLSFYEVGEKKVVANPTTTNTPHTGLLSLLDFEGEHYTQIVRVSMSFRFDGDFFDRYWTCWFLSADPQMELTKDDAEEAVKRLLEGEQSRKNEADLQKAPWRQRRVLELLMFGRIICYMRRGADNILKLAKSSIRKKSRNPGETTQDGLEDADELDYNAFLATRRRFERFQKVLQTVQGDLAENLTRVDQWLDREKERQAERPRWTFNDESRYRSVISKLNFSNDHEVQELRRSYAKIVTFNDSIAKKLDIMRNDVDQRRADDIQRFTWVTIFFLPMGFATGVYSMNGAPAGQTLWHMVVTMVGALLITALLLMYSRAIEKVYEWVSGLVRDFGRTVFGSMRPSPGPERDRSDYPTARQGMRERLSKRLKRNGMESDPERGVVTNIKDQNVSGEVEGSQDRLTAAQMSNGVRDSEN